VREKLGAHRIFHQRVRVAGSGSHLFFDQPGEKVGVLA
jgi:hypothetical protein